MRNKEIVKVVDCNVTREGFTRHGQHLNTTDKVTLALHIAHELSKCPEVNTQKPISIPWNKTPTDHTTSEHENKPNNLGPLQEKTPPIRNYGDCGPSDIIKVLKQSISAECEVTLDTSNDPRNRTSTKRRSPQFPGVMIFYGVKSSQGN